MTKRNFVLVALLFAGVCAFGEAKILNVGSYEIGDVSISCWDNNGLMILDLEDTTIFITCIDIDTLIRASAKTKEIMEWNNIRSVEQMLRFFDREKIQYVYEGGNSFYYVEAQAFLEEYLVPKYGIKPGKKEIHEDHTAEYKNWNKGKQWYDYSLDTYADHTEEYKNWNKDKRRYDYRLDTYTDHTMELKWDKDNVYRLDTYADHTEEYKNWNKDKQRYDYRLDTYTDHTMELKWDKDNAYRLDTYADHTEEYKNWNKDYNRFDYHLDTYTDRIVEWKRVDGTYFDVDIKDKSGKVIAYDHVIKPLKNGKRDIEVFSGGIVYQYFGVQQTKDDKFIFKSMKKKENGVTTKMKGGTLSEEDFYMDAYMLQ